MREEKKLWKGNPAWFNLAGIDYTLTNQRISIKSGIFSRRVHDIELINVKNVSFYQGFFQMMFNIGNLFIKTNNSNVSLNNIYSPVHVKEIIRKAILAEKETKVIYQETLLK
jgi:uncharacterized membrane protein YdbT with pleckstrin-like domain